MKRTRRYTGSEFWVRLAVQGRFGGRCCRCGRDGATIQHRKPRRAGGTRRPEINHPSNLLWVCGTGTTGCHGHMESYRTEALDNGWLLHDRADAREEPVLLWDGRRVLLDDEGGWTYSGSASDTSL